MQGIDAQGFLHHSPSVGEAPDVVEGGEATGEHLVGLGPQSREALGVLGEEVQGPLQAVGGGLEAGQEQAERLVEELLVGHGLAGLLVSGVEHQAEQVVTPVVEVAASSLDEAVHHRTESGGRLAEVIAPGHRDPPRQLVGEHPLEHVVDGEAELLEGDVGDLLGGRGPEDHRRDDVHGQSRNAAADLEDLPVLAHVTPGQGPVDRLDDGASHRLQPSLVELRLHQASLS